MNRTRVLKKGYNCLKKQKCIFIYKIKNKHELKINLFIKFNEKN